MALSIQVACGGTRGTDSSREDAERDVDAGEKPRRAAASTAGAVALVDIGCDEHPAHEAQCGNTECPPAPQTSPGTCGVVVCCTPDVKCGLRSAVTLNGEPASDVCVPTAAPDARCPEVKLGLGTVPGCCDVFGNCGQLLGLTCGVLADARPCAAGGGM
jgi:hypothetical protein